MTRPVEGKQRNQLKDGLEATEQRNLIKWWDSVAAEQFGISYTSLLYHVANGGSRDFIEACQLKLQGVRRGVPDLFLAVPRNGKHGLYIELKATRSGSLSEYQKQFLIEARLQGYEAWACHGCVRAQELISAYLTCDKLTPVDTLIYHGLGPETNPFLKGLLDV